MIDIRNKVLENFLELIKEDTKSDEKSEKYPSTDSQLKFGEKLVKKCKEIGLKEVKMDEKGYVTGKLEKTTKKDSKTIGFIAHMDTSPDFDGKVEEVNIVKNYDGKDIKLCEGVILSVKEFPKLKNYIGKTLVTTKGKTLLGGDDKAGIAEILTAFEYLKNSDLEYTEIKLAFTPDEEIGKGVDYFNVEEYNCDYGYTIDGGEEGELSFENFNAAEISINIKGKNVHPGYGTGVMVNAALIGSELIEKVKEENPRTTKGYEGFYHLTEIEGNVEKASLKFIIRDFEKEKFQDRKKYIVEEIEKLKNKYNIEIKYKMEDNYYNMVEIIKDKMEVVEKAKRGIEKTGLKVKIKAIRGGTDGARLSYMGLPCPNIFTGGHNFHGPYEYVCVESMEKAVETIINIATDV